MQKFIKKPGYIYSLKRSNGEDHNNGRPAILLKYLGDQCLVWFGTTKIQSNEEPVFVKQLNKSTYFYAKGIAKANTDDLIRGWNVSRNSTYSLTKEEYKNLIGTFAKINNLNDPYLRINDLEKEMLQLKNQYIKLENKTNQIIEQQQQLLEINKELNEKLNQLQSDVELVR